MCIRGEKVDAVVLYGTDVLIQRRQAYDLLALAAAEQWGLSPLPPMERGAHGKPCFAGRGEYQFNLSHSGSLALCALDRLPVGVDIQIVRTWRPGLLRRVCSETELDWVNRGEEVWSRFTQLWALKESRVKYSAEGLTRPIAGIRVPLPECLERPYFLDGLWFRAYEGDGWRGAVCGENPPPDGIRWIIF